MAGEVREIELWPCGYEVTCRVRNCRARATTIARSIDTGGRPIHQYEMCATHAEHIAEREQAIGRRIIRR
jgi:hypothetical protein